MYLQELKAGSTPIFIGMGADPHWYTEGDRTFIVYSTKGGATGSDLALITDVSDTSAGVTMKLEINLGSRAAHEFFPEGKEGKMLVNLPFKGGLSPDGLYLATGYQMGYIYALKTLY